MGIFFLLTTGSVMTSDQYDFFIKFIRLKPSFFMVIDSEDIFYDFIVDCFELLHKINKMERLSAEF